MRIFTVVFNTEYDMFKANSQLNLFSYTTELSKKQRELLDNSKEKWFYKLIFSNIDEMAFKPLYSTKASRPNVAANILVSAMILKEFRGISYNELMESVMFDMRFKTALGMVSIDEQPFSRATLFNFQNRILEYEEQTGINLIEQVFDNLTAQQIKQLKLKTDIQRTDSTLISSNIKKYSRVQLLIEVLLRLERILQEEDKTQISKLLQAYLKTGSDKYVYALKSNELPRELEKLGKVYHAVHTIIEGKATYEGEKAFVNFERVYKEHFVVVHEQVSPKANDELSSSMLQSPDDQEATYRKKNGQHNKGYTINGTETANPENPVQLVTDVGVNPNNIDDSVILNQRIENLKEKTPELNEIHTDGGYGSQDNDKALLKLKITQITTAVRGRESEIPKKIEQLDEKSESYIVECPHQKVTSKPTPKHHKGQFDLSICKGCPLNQKCQIFKDKGRFYFNHKDYLRNKRNRNINSIPKERRKIRPNVEALMKEFKTKTQAGKLKVRGLFKTSLFAYNMGIAINFGRIYRYVSEKNIKEAFSLNLKVFLAKISSKKQIVNFQTKLFRQILKSKTYFTTLRLSIKYETLCI